MYRAPCSGCSINSPEIGIQPVSLLLDEHSITTHYGYGSHHLIRVQHMTSSRLSIVMQRSRPLTALQQQEQATRTRTGVCQSGAQISKLQSAVATLNAPSAFNNVAVSSSVHRLSLSTPARPFGRTLWMSPQLASSAASTNGYASASDVAADGGAIIRSMVRHSTQHCIDPLAVEGCINAKLRCRGVYREYRHDEQTRYFQPADRREPWVCD
jgi:hypothetical protein